MGNGKTLVFWIIQVSPFRIRSFVYERKSNYIRDREDRVVLYNFRSFSMSLSSSEIVICCRSSSNFESK